MPRPGTPPAIQCLRQSRPGRLAGRQRQRQDNRGPTVSPGRCLRNYHPPAFAGHDTRPGVLYIGPQPGGPAPAWPRSPASRWGNLVQRDRCGIRPGRVVRGIFGRIYRGEVRCRAYLVYLGIKVLRPARAEIICCPRSRRFTAGSIPRWLMVALLNPKTRCFCRIPAAVREHQRRTDRAG